MFRAVLLSTILALALGASGCIIEDSSDPGPSDQEITCNHFADFTYNCTANCNVTWDCEASYSSLDLDSQLALDDCSDCLVANLNAGVCADCIDTYVGSCQDFMEYLLGVDCW
jgi:hypothetical protein